jgi:hypothetical protein
MPSPVEFLVHHYLILLVAAALAAALISYVQQRVRAPRAASWPGAEGTIQSVDRLVVGTPFSPSYGPGAPYIVDVGDFSYVVNNVYYSGRLKTSRSFSTGTASPKELIDQKIQVRYNPRNPEQYFVPPQEIGGFLLDPFDEPAAKDGPVDLNLDKI